MNVRRVSLILEVRGLHVLETDTARYTNTQYVENWRETAIRRKECIVIAIAVGAGFQGNSDRTNL